MNFSRAKEILEMDDQEISHSFIKKQYHAKALMFHPDKNKEENASAKFQEIQEAYEFLTKNAPISSPEPNSYTTLLRFFMGSIDEPYHAEYIQTLLEKVLSVCEMQALQIIQHANYSKFMMIYNILTKYRHVFHLSDLFYVEMEKRSIYWLSQGNMKKQRLYETLRRDFVLSEEDRDEDNKRYKKVIHSEWNLEYEVEIPECEGEENQIETMILRPTLNDLWEHNLYRYTKNEEKYLIPLWHHELLYEYQESDFIVKIIPALPSLHFWIDSDNNLHQKIEYTIREMWDAVLQGKCLEVYFGKKRFVFYPTDLKLTQVQTWTWHQQGISKIQEQSIYDISRKADVVLHIYIN